MEYIQCSHCQKKYGVNDKLKSAAGKQIRCKHCHETFEIVIHDNRRALEPQTDSEVVVCEQAADQSLSPDPSESSAQDNRQEEPKPTKADEVHPPSEEEKGKEQPTKKTVNIHALISVVLGVTLIFASVGGYLFLNKPELFGINKQPEPKSVIPQNLVDPMAAGPAVAKQTKAPLTKRNNGASQSAQALKICKDLAADYWVRTRLLATAELDANTYMALLNMNLEQAQEIRKVCKEKSLVAKLAEAVRTNTKPQWIKPEIDARLQQNAQSKAQHSQNLSPQSTQSDDK